MSVRVKSGVGRPWQRDTYFIDKNSGPESNLYSTTKEYPEKDGYVATQVLQIPYKI